MLARECRASRSRSPACAELATRRQVRSPSHTPCVPGRPVDRQTDKIQIQIPSRAHVRHSRCVRVSWKNQIPLFSRRCSSLLAVRIVVCLSVTATTTRRSLYSLCIRVFVCVRVCVAVVACASCRDTPTPGTKSNSSSNADCRWRCPARTRCCRHRRCRRRCDTSNRYFCVCFRIRFQFSHVLLRVQTRCFRFVLLLPSTHKAFNSNSNNNISNISATTSAPESQSNI